MKNVSFELLLSDMNAAASTKVANSISPVNPPGQPSQLLIQPGELELSLVGFAVGWVGNALEL